MKTNQPVFQSEYYFNFRFYMFYRIPNQEGKIFIILKDTEANILIH